ncbi:MAG: SPOR domain-containing protein [Pseudomonadota bacterium]
MARKQARRGNGGSGALTGFVMGLICGLGLAALAWVGGYLPRGDELGSGIPNGRNEPPIIDSAQNDAGSARARDRQYEFFTVLPEIEVVVPTAEIEQRARETELQSQPNNPANAASNPALDANQQYVIQAGSFRTASDAESLKARLAMLGQVATVQTVTVNEVTWHRVRLGPFNASQANQTRQQLLDGGFESMVLSGN